jgi:hypothetical protein
VTDEEDVAAAGGEAERVERPAAQLGRRLGLEAERLAGEPRRFGGADLGAGQAGVDLGVRRRQRFTRRPCLALALRRQPAGVVVA